MSWAIVSKLCSEVNIESTFFLQWARPPSFNIWPRGESQTTPSSVLPRGTNPVWTDGEQTSVFPAAVTIWVTLRRARPMTRPSLPILRGKLCYLLLTLANLHGSPVLSPSQPCTISVRTRMKSWCSSPEPCHSLFCHYDTKMSTFFISFFITLTHISCGEPFQVFMNIHILPHLCTFKEHAM